MQVEVDYQGGGTYKRKYRVRELIPKGPFELMFKNEQVSFEGHHHCCVCTLVQRDYCGRILIKQVSSLRIVVSDVALFSANAR